MNEFLDKIWLDNAVRSYLIVGVVILFVTLFRKYISKYIAWIFSFIVGRIWKGINKKSFISLVIQPIGYFLSILVTIAALHQLQFPQQLDIELYKHTLKDLIHWFATVVLIVSFINLLLRIIDFIAIILEQKTGANSDQSNNQLIIFFKSFFKVILVVLGAVLILKYAFRYNVSSLLTGLSIVSAAIAFSLRESLENLIASFIIFFDKPFTTGDTVKVQQIIGSVEKIGLRSTRIRTEQKTYVSVPNKQMVDSIVDNLSLRTQRRGDLKLELGLDTSAAQIEELLAALKIITNRSGVETTNVFLTEITGTAIVIHADYYTAPITMNEFNEIKQSINLEALQLLEKLQIEIAGAATDVRIQK